MLEIVYQDPYLVAINKPHNLLVHRSPIARDAEQFALQLLRDQLGQLVFPAHRLDRKTGGVLLFALDKETGQKMQSLFMKRAVKKSYLAVVRGYSDAEGYIDYPLRKEDGPLQDATTSYRTIAQSEIPIPHGQFATSRYSLIEAAPETGRMHQLRKHFAHILHPIIGDRPHGCNKQNKFWKETYHMDTMLLHASQLSFRHPATDSLTTVKAGLQPEFRRSLDILDLSKFKTHAIENDEN